MGRFRVAASSARLVCLTLRPPMGVRYHLGSARPPPNLVGRSPRAAISRVATRSKHCQLPYRAQEAVVQPPFDEAPRQRRDSSNPALSFPCIDARDAKSAFLSTRSLGSGPEPSYT